MKETIFYFIRHAQCQPSSSLLEANWPLSEVGYKQALLLSNLLDFLEVDTVLTSPFLRCKQTIDPYIKKHNLNFVVENDFRERLISKKIINGFYEVWSRSWDDFNFSLPECESSAVAQERFVEAVKKYEKVNRGKRVAISTHGNVIGLFLNWIDNKVGKLETEKITNPDVLKVIVQGGVYQWDRKFVLDGIKKISTDHKETKMD